jgi:hypothetical protein
MVAAQKGRRVIRFVLNPELGLLLRKRRAIAASSDLASLARLAVSA